MNDATPGEDVDEQLLDAIGEQLREQWAKTPPPPNPDAIPDNIDALRKRLEHLQKEGGHQ